jgi:lysyl-tRNA synthetase class 2
VIRHEHGREQPERFDMQSFCENTTTAFRGVPIQQSSEVLNNFREDAPTALRGRVVNKRDFGKLLFYDLIDATGQIQLMADETSAALPLLRTMKNGDLVAVLGKTTYSRKRHPSVAVDDSVIIAGCEVSLPDKHTGIRDLGIRYRNRPLALVTDRELLKFFMRCSVVVQAIRTAMFDRGYHEFDTGTLQSRFDAGFAQPFITRVNATNKECYLRLTSEVRLKELLLAGCEAAFEIGKSFRNEGMSKLHHPEFTLFEAYRSHAKCADMCRLLEEVIEKGVLKAYGTSQISLPLAGEVDFSQPWQRITFNDAVATFTPFKVTTASTENEIRKETAGAAGFSPDMHYRLLIEKIMYRGIIPKLLKPTFITELPISMSPFVSRLKSDENASDRAWAVIDRIFCSDIYTDESDRDILRAALTEQTKQTGKPANEQFLQNLALGIPPSAGFGTSLNRLFMVLRGKELPDHIFETILYPLV